MSAFTEFVDSVSQTMKDRVSNPLSGSFIIAWCVCNFRLLLVIVGEGQFDAKLTYINANLGPDNLGWVEFGMRNMGWPVLWALLYVFAYPWAAHKAMAFTRKMQNDWKAQQAGIDRTRTVTIEELEASQAETADLKLRLSDAKSSLQLERDSAHEYRQQAEADREKLNKELQTVRTQAEQASKTQIAVISKMNADQQPTDLEKGAMSKLYRNNTPIRLLPENDISSETLGGVLRKGYAEITFSKARPLVKMTEAGDQKVKMLGLGLGNRYEFADSSRNDDPPI